MPRSSTPIWKSIQTQLRGEISDGIHQTGEKLPTEAELAKRFGVNRHTVRHAMKSLAEDGLVVSRRGAGVFVIGQPTDYPIGRRVRFHQNIRAAGRSPAKEVLDLSTRRATQDEAAALELPDQAMVHAYEGLSMADNMPIAMFQSIFPADRFPNLLEHLRDGGSVTKALAAEGLSDYTRVSTRLTAKQATPTQAGLLKIAPSAPILRSVGINTDVDGTPIEYGRTWFVGDRVTLTLNDDGNFTS